MIMSLSHGLQLIIPALGFKAPAMRAQPEENHVPLTNDPAAD